MIDRKYWTSDKEWLSIYEFSDHSRSRLTNYLAQDKYKYLKSTTINECPYCNGDLYRTFSSSTCGHGESDETIRYRCFGCSLDITESYGYGRGFDACDESFTEKTQSIIDVILRRNNNVYRNSLQEE